ncbi:putative fatty acyl-CoA reductase CG5065 [Chironomus tepperi]|uniref:putative fatty acyl-CoA reductase CG5065 n=1 Tax=Chironomus tepperi TaxID=113505 RepID=UPI00391F36AE
MNESQISIAEFYKGQNIFLTGGTGFIGKVLVEKLLRSCPGIENIYLLCRSKKGKSINERLEEITSSPAFDLLREQNPQALNKIILIEGDVAMLELGISKEDQQILKDKVSIVMHSAATIDFNEPLKIAVNTNLRSIRELLNLAKDMKNLKSFVHISTAFANWFELDVKEQVYPTLYDPDDIIELADRLPDETVNKMTPILLGKHVNTYTFTKNLAENLIKREKNLPVIIIKPSMVGASLSEPHIGWIDSLTGASRYIYLIAKGVYRSTFMPYKSAAADFVPVDFTSNLTIAAPWKREIDIKSDSMVHNPYIYFSTTGSTNKLLWKDYINDSRDLGRKYPPSNVFWYPQVRMHKTEIGHHIDVALTHLMPAYLMDLAAKVTGQKARAYRLQKQVKDGYQATIFVTSIPYVFQAKNFNNVLNSMSEADKKEFNFDPRTINWKQYMQDYYFGMRKFIVKEKDMKSPALMRRLTKLKYTNYFVKLSTGAAGLFLIWKSSGV